MQKLSLGAFHSGGALAGVMATQKQVLTHVLMGDMKMQGTGRLALTNSRPGS